jgi:hypothetical protein
MIVCSFEVPFYRLKMLIQKCDHSIKKLLGVPKNAFVGEHPEIWRSGIRHFIFVMILTHLADSEAIYPLLRLELRLNIQTFPLS